MYVENGNKKQAIPRNRLGPKTFYHNSFPPRRHCRQRYRAGFDGLNAEKIRKLQEKLFKIFFATFYLKHRDMELVNPLFRERIFKHHISREKMSEIQNSRKHGHKATKRHISEMCHRKRSFHSHNPKPKRDDSRHGLSKPDHLVVFSRCSSDDTSFGIGYQFLPKLTPKRKPDWIDDKVVTFHRIHLRTDHSMEKKHIASKSFECFLHLCHNAADAHNKLMF